MWSEYLFGKHLLKRLLGTRYIVKCEWEKENNRLPEGSLKSSSKDYDNK